MVEKFFSVKVVVISTNGIMIKEKFPPFLTEIIKCQIGSLDIMSPHLGVDLSP